MTSAAYKSATRRLGVLYLTTYFGVSIPILAALLFIADRISAVVSFDRSLVFLMITPFACAGFVLGASAVQMVARKVEIRCPHCGGSLSLRCDPRKVLAAGECPHCSGKLFQSAADATHES